MTTKIQAAREEVETRQQEVEAAGTAIKNAYTALGDLRQRIASATDPLELADLQAKATALQALLPNLERQHRDKKLALKIYQDVLEDLERGRSNLLVIAESTERKIDALASGPRLGEILEELWQIARGLPYPYSDTMRDGISKLQSIHVEYQRALRAKEGIERDLASLGE